MLQGALYLLAGPVWDVLGGLLAVFPVNALAALSYIFLGCALASASRPISRSPTAFRVAAVTVLTCTFAAVVLVWLYRKRSAITHAGALVAFAVAASGLNIALNTMSFLAVTVPILASAMSFFGAVFTVACATPATTGRLQTVFLAFLVVLSMLVIVLGVFLLLVAPSMPILLPKVVAAKLALAAGAVSATTLSLVSPHVLSHTLLFSELRSP
jgi:hypothetical protein